MKIKNYTGYEVKLRDGRVVRPVGNVRVNLEEVAEVEGPLFDIISLRCTGIVGLPEQEEGVFILVTHTVARHVLREDMLVCGRRDERGRTTWFERPGVPEVRGVPSAQVQQ